MQHWYERGAGNNGKKTMKPVMPMGKRDAPLMAPDPEELQNTQEPDKVDGFVEPVKKLSDVTAMVIDNGSYVDFARTLGRTFKKVYYCTPSWVQAEPDIKTAYIGYGYKELQIVPRMFSVPVEEIDLYVFCDVGYGDDELYLESIGKKVWGARKGEELEFFRDDAKKQLKKIGLPVGPYKVITGTTELREYLKKNKDQIAKLDVFRGVTETFRSVSYETSQYVIDDLDVQLGAVKNEIEFIVEEMLKDKVEVGTDCFCIDGKFPSQMLYGIEVKDVSYCAQFTKYDKIPKEVREVNEKLSPVLKEKNYRTFYSTEIRIGKDKVPYLIDLTLRMPEPPGSLYQVFYKNLAEIVYRGACGEVVDPDPAGKFGVQLILQSRFNKNWQPIKVSEKFDKYVFLKNACLVDGIRYVMPQKGEELAQIGAIVGYGETLQEAIDMVKEISETIEAIDLEMSVKYLEDAEEEIGKAREMGLWVD